MTSWEKSIKMLKKNGNRFKPTLLLTNMRIFRTQEIMQKQNN